MKQQNKYLYNYIHKLEFLISQNQKDRVNYDLKFKKLVSHITYSFTKKNFISENLVRALKSIEGMGPEDTMAYAKKEISYLDALDDNNLK